MATFTRNWDETQPTNLTEAHQIDDHMKYLRVDVAERLKAMFYGFIAGENTYEASVKFLNLKDQSSVATPSSGYSRFYTKTVTGKSEIFAQNDDGDEIQLTTDGKLNVLADSITETHIQLTNNSHLIGRNAAGTGDVNLIRANTSDKAELPDGAQLATSAAPTADAQLANKKYVDDARLQVQRTQTGSRVVCSTAIPYDNTIPQITEGTEVMTCAITPKSASSKLVVEVTVIGAPSTSSYPAVALFEASIDAANALAVATGGHGNSESLRTITFSHVLNSPGTSALTFRVRAGCDTGGTFYFNGDINNPYYGGKLASSVTITEILT